MTGVAPDGVPDDALPGGAAARRRRALDAVPSVGPHLAPYTVPVLVGAALGTGLAVIGLRVQDAVLVALVAATVILLGRTIERGQEFAWPEPSDDAGDGARREVAALSWTFVGRDGRVSEAAVRRVRQEAERRLARHGVDLPAGLAAAAAPGPRDAHDARAVRAQEMLGDRAWRALAGRGGAMPSLRDLQHCVDVLERLETAPAPRRRGRHHDARVTAPVPTAAPTRAPLDRPSDALADHPPYAPDGRTAP